MKSTLNMLLTGFAISAMVFASCSKEDVEPLIATSINLVSGNSQTAIIETTLTNAIEVIVKDQNGNAFEGVTVKFAVSEGSVSSATVSTNAAGKATTMWTLGASEGTQTLSATAFEADGTTALAGSPVSFTATGEPVPLVATSIEVVLGEGQNATIETALTSPVKVIVKDQNGDPIAGTNVEFAVSEGSVSSTTVAAGADGKCETTWTLGASVGTQTLTITAYQADGTTALTGSPLTVSATGKEVVAIELGAFYEGGVIFYLDNTGQHGLICAVNEQSTGAVWGCNFTEGGADGTAVGTGAQNTIDIEAICTDEGTAADICANLELNGYTDWFLPSIAELGKLFRIRSKVDATAKANGGVAITSSTSYWSSTKYLDYKAGAINYTETQHYQARTTEYYVRAVRAF